MTQKALAHDSVSLFFSVEELIVSDTVKVTLKVTKILSDNIDFNIKNTLREVYEVDWTITNLSRYEETGLERINATAIARIPDSQISKINTKAKEVSKAGLEIQVSEFDYSPQRNKIEETKRSLRERIYKLAEDEAALLNIITKDGKLHPWRIGRVEFVRADSNSSNMRSVATTAAYFNAPEGGAADEQPDMDLSYRVNISANVSVTRTLDF